MREVQSDIYAKEEKVRELAFSIAKLQAYTIAHTGRWASADSSQRMLEGRDEIKRFLAEIGGSRQDTDNAIAEIDRMMLFDLVNELYNLVHHHIRTQLANDEKAASELQEIKEGIEGDRNQAPKMRKRLEEHDLMQYKDIREAWQALEQFVQTGNLPPGYSKKY